MHVFPRLLNIVSAVSIVSGMTISGVQAGLLANLTAPGSTILDQAPAAGLTFHQAANSYSVAYQTANAGLQLITGMLLILLGCFLHAWARTRNRERAVHITVKPKKKRQMWFWVDLHI